MWSPRRGRRCSSGCSAWPVAGRSRRSTRAGEPRRSRATSWRRCRSPRGWCSWCPGGAGTSLLLPLAPCWPSPVPSPRPRWSRRAGPRPAGLLVVAGASAAGAAGRPGHRLGAADRSPARRLADHRGPVLRRGQHGVRRARGIGPARRGRRRSATPADGPRRTAIATRRCWPAAVLLVVALVDAAPPLGADVGGALALMPSALVLVLLLARAADRPGGAACSRSWSAQCPSLALAWWDYRRPAEQRTHIGRFVAQVLDGACRARCSGASSRPTCTSCGPARSCRWSSAPSWSSCSPCAPTARRLARLLRETPGLGGRSDRLHRVRRAGGPAQRLRRHRDWHHALGGPADGHGPRPACRPTPTGSRRGRPRPGPALAVRSAGRRRDPRWLPAAARRHPWPLTGRPAARCCSSLAPGPVATWPPRSTTPGRSATAPCCGTTTGTAAICSPATARSSLRWPRWSAPDCSVRSPRSAPPRRPVPCSAGRGPGGPGGWPRLWFALGSLVPVVVGQLPFGLGLAFGLAALLAAARERALAGGPGRAGGQPVQPAGRWLPAAGRARVGHRGRAAPGRPARRRPSLGLAVASVFGGGGFFPFPPRAC